MAWTRPYIYIIHYKKRNISDYTCRYNCKFYNFAVLIFGGIPFYRAQDRL